MQEMNLANLPAGMIDWSAIASSEHPGESGTATIRARQLGEIQLRVVEYSPSYLADHWCHEGHLLFVVAGQMVIEHEDGTTWNLTAGTSWQVADDEGSPHRARSAAGATVFIVD
jgi:hypothetical protein